MSRAHDLRFAARALAATVLLWMLATPAQAGTWRSFSTAEFDVIGDAPLSEMRRTASAIEVYRYALQQAVPAMAKPGSLRPRVFVLAPDTYAKYVQPNDQVLGFTAVRDFTVDVVVDADSTNWIQTSQIVMHELTHFYLHTNLEARPPSWFDEGLAEFFSTVDREKKTVRIGRVPIGRWNDLQELRWVPLEELFSARVSANRPGDEKYTAAFYAQVWALMHYVYIGNPSRLPAIVHLLKLQNLGYSPADALRGAFPAGLAEFEAELQHYRRSQSFKYGQLKDALIVAESVETLELPESAGRTELALLMLRMQLDTEKIEAILRPMTAGTISDRALSALALVSAKLDRKDRAQFLDACRTQSRSSTALILCGDALFVPLFENREGTSAGAAPSAAAQRDIVAARNLYERALSADPRQFEALFSLSVTYLFEPQQVVPLIPRLEEAMVALPHSWVMRDNLVSIYHSLGRNADARRHLEKMLLSSTDSRSRLSVIKALEDIDAAESSSAQSATRH